MKGSPKNLHRHRAFELMGLADKTDDPAVVAELLELAAEQLGLEERAGAPQQQEQAQPKKK
jgi:hypothetical protein